MAFKESQAFRMHRRVNVYCSRFVTSLPVNARAAPFLDCIDENRISFAVTAERFPEVPIRINEHTYTGTGAPCFFILR